MIKHDKYFFPPPNDESNFKELFKRLAAAGAGRSVDKDGFPKGPWTPELLAEAITQIGANRDGIDLRTVQLWFQDNDKGISTDNIRWLARVFGCDDPDATSQWQMALSAANSRLVAKRKAGRQTARPSPQMVQGIETTTPTKVAPVVLTNQSIWHFNLAKKTEALFDNQSSLGLPVVVFTAATALGLIAFTLNIHSVVYKPESGPAKQVGFLWAPNWTIVFLVILPMYLALLIDLLRCWKGEWRGRLVAVHDPTLSPASWESRVASASYSYWAVFFVTVVIASGYNWTATHLVPLLTGDAGGWPVDWGRIAIFRPDIISVPSAVVFTGLVFLYNAFCAYLFFTGLIFLNAMTHDYANVVNGLQKKSIDEPQQDIEEMSFSLMNGIFRCTSLGMLITIMMKLQSSFLQSESVNILDWLAANTRSLLDVHGSLESSHAGVRSAPGHFYSFFCVLAIFGTFLNASVKVRLALARLHLSKTGTQFHIPWAAMNGTMVLLVTSYLLIDSVTGFTLVLFFSLPITVYLIIKPAFRQRRAIMEG